MVEQAVAHQAAEQPKQEGIIEDAFMKLDATISRVATLAKSYDGTELSLRAHNTVPFTMAMSLAEAHHGRYHARHGAHGRHDSRARHPEC